MRRALGLIIDHVRNRRAQKRGGLFELTALTTDVVESSPQPDTDQLQEISDALDALAALDAPLAETVDRKLFCGFSFAEIAGIVSEADAPQMTGPQMIGVAEPDGVRISACTNEHSGPVRPSSSHSPSS